MRVSRPRPHHRSPYLHRRIAEAKRTQALRWQDRWLAEKLRQYRDSIRPTLPIKVH